MDITAATVYHQQRLLVSPPAPGRLTVHESAPLSSFKPNKIGYLIHKNDFCISLCLPIRHFNSTPKTRFNPSIKLYVSGLSFRTTENSLRNAFSNFGVLIEVNLVMDRIANRPRGFAFIRYATEEECKKAIEGMHGKFLDGRVIFVEVAKSPSELQRGPNR